MIRTSRLVVLFLSLAFASGAAAPAADVLKEYRSAHFNYYTRGNGSRLALMEKHYATLTNVLSFYGTAPRKPRITYRVEQLGQWKVPCANYDLCAVWDAWDCASSHEMIHCLVMIPCVPFNEGFAQCFQREGHDLYPEQNVNLVARYVARAANPYQIFETVVERALLTGRLSHYHLLGSFVYYHVFGAGKRDGFVRFLKGLVPGETLGTVKAKYRAALGVDFEAAAAAWFAWLRGIERDGDIWIEAWGLPVGVQRGLPRAARDGNLAEVRRLLAGKPDLAAGDSSGLTALHLAARHGHVPVMRLLLDNGAAPEPRERTGNTPLHLAALAGHAAAATLLLERGAPVDAKNGKGFTPLFFAAGEGRADLVRLLAARGADPNARTANGYTPLRWAAEKGPAGMQDLLRGLGAR